MDDEEEESQDQLSNLTTNSAQSSVNPRMSLQDWEQDAVKNIFQITLDVSNKETRWKTSLTRSLSITHSLPLSLSIYLSISIFLQRQEAERTNWSLLYLSDVSQELAEENGGVGELDPSSLSNLCSHVSHSFPLISALLSTVPKLSTSMADRIMLSRLSLDPVNDVMSDDADKLTALASLPKGETCWDYLVACWKRAKQEQNRLRKVSSVNQVIDLVDGSRRRHRVECISLSLQVERDLSRVAFSLCASLKSFSFILSHNNTTLRCFEMMSEPRCMLGIRPLLYRL